MKKTLAQQVRAYMETRGTSYSPSDMAADVAKHQPELPARMRCKRQNIEQLLEKDFSTTRYLVALASAMGTNAETLAAGRYSPTDPVLSIPEDSYIDSNKEAMQIDLENNPDYPAIRRVAFKLSAGASGFGVEYRDGDGAPIVFQRKWYTDNGFDPAALFAVRVANGSMEPGLYDGDTVVVNTKSVEPKDGVVFAVNYEGEMVIKRLVRDGGQWWLASDNPNQQRYPRKVCDEHSRLIGEVVHKQSMRI